MTASEDDRLRRYWGQYAPRYDKDMRRRERLLFTGGRSWACSQASGDVLEAGVGTGLNFPCHPPLTGLLAAPVGGCYYYVP
jgi:hypothetical protein